MRSSYLGIRKNKLNKDFQNTNNKNEVIFDLSKLNGVKQKDVRIPIKLTSELAEEIGIHLGDGHLSKNKNRYKLFGNINESDYYKDFIVELYKRLFNIKVKIVTRPDNTIGFEIYSKSLWIFKSEILKLSCGRKDSASVPEIILNSSSEIQKSFVRGLFGTDGNIYFQSRYGYKNYYPVLSVECKSKKLIENTANILTNLGFKVSLYQTKRGYSVVMLYGYENVIKYAEEIGWHNKKHLAKFLQWKEKYPYLIKRNYKGHHWDSNPG